MARETWTDERIDDFKENVNERFDGVEKRMDQRFDHVDREFQRVDKRFEQVDKRFDQVERKMSEGFAHVEGEIKEMRQTMNHGFFVLVGIQASTILTMIGLKFL
ncbi:MAG TPA: hypothetical protein VNN15_01410 [Solirubrobacterales bacterium]|nr:hypothetical protein [Solirubrobacterales bacterium]